MRSNSGATAPNDNRRIQHIFNSVRMRILSNVDVPFILITGRNKNSQLVTVGELICALDGYRNDLNILINAFGEDVELLKTIDLALTQIECFEILIQNGQLQQNALVKDVYADEKGKSFLLILSVQMAKALNIFDNKELEKADAG